MARCWATPVSWWDHDTGSIWSQPLGEAVAGPQRGKRLDLLPSQLTSWGTWRQQYPATQALVAAGRRSSFELDQMDIVVEIGDAATAYSVRAVREAGIANDVVAGIAMAVVVGQEIPDQWAVFARALAGSELQLVLAAGAILDPSSGTRWHAGTGVGIAGPLADQPLARIAGFTAFPRDFKTFWPNGTRWTR